MRKETGNTEVHLILLSYQRQEQERSYLAYHLFYREYQSCNSLAVRCELLVIAHLIVVKECGHIAQKGTGVEVCVISAVLFGPEVLEADNIAGLTGTFYLLLCRSKKLLYLRAVMVHVILQKK